MFHRGCQDEIISCRWKRWKELFLWGNVKQSLVSCRALQQRSGLCLRLRGYVKQSLVSHIVLLSADQVIVGQPRIYSCYAQPSRSIVSEISRLFQLSPGSHLVSLLRCPDVCLYFASSSYIFAAWSVLFPSGPAPLQWLSTGRKCLVVAGSLLNLFPKIQRRLSHPACYAFCCQFVGFIFVSCIFTVQWKLIRMACTS